MSRTAAKVTQADVARALRAAQSVGPKWHVRIDRDGTIHIVQGDPPPEAKRQPVASEEEIIL